MLLSGIFEVKFTIQAIGALFLKALFLFLIMRYICVQKRTVRTIRYSTRQHSRSAVNCTNLEVQYGVLCIRLNFSNLSRQCLDPQLHLRTAKTRNLIFCVKLTWSKQWLLSESDPNFPKLVQ